MTPDEAVVAVLDALDRAALPWMLVGSLASNFHGVPRATRDADFVIAFDRGDVDTLAATLPSALRLDAQGAFEPVTGTTRYLIELQGSLFVCELFVLSDDAHDQERFARRQRVPMFGRHAFVATAEDTIVTKLRWAKDAGRSKDRGDIRNIVALRRSGLDWPYIEHWAAAHGTTELLQTLRMETDSERSR